MKAIRKDRHKKTQKTQKSFSYEEHEVLLRLDARPAVLAPVAAGQVGHDKSVRWGWGIKECQRDAGGTEDPALPRGAGFGVKVAQGN